MDGSMDRKSLMTRKYAALVAFVCCFVALLLWIV
jgi:hypothetical protein